MNLFAIFASSVRIEREQASRAVHSYLSSHFGVRSHKEYIELYNTLRNMYDDSLFVLDKEQIVRNICEQMKVKLRAEEQLLLLIRFVEFAYTNSREADLHLELFHLVADIFSIPQEEFDDSLAFITGKPSHSRLLLSLIVILLIDRNSNHKLSKVIFLALDENSALMVQDNFATEVQPHAGCFGCRLRCKERFEYLVFDIVFNADTVITYGKEYRAVQPFLHMNVDNWLEFLLLQLFQ